MNQPDNRPTLIINLHRSLWFLLAAWFVGVSIVSLLVGELSPALAYAGPLLLIAATLARAIVMMLYFHKSGDRPNRQLSLLLIIVLILTGILGYAL